MLRAEDDAGPGDTCGCSNVIILINPRDVDLVIKRLRAVANQANALLGLPARGPLQERG